MQCLLWWTFLQCKTIYVTLRCHTWFTCLIDIISTYSLAMRLQQMNTDQHGSQTEPISRLCHAFYSHLLQSDSLSDGRHQITPQIHNRGCFPGSRNLPKLNLSTLQRGQHLIHRSCSNTMMENKRIMPGWVKFCSCWVLNKLLIKQLQIFPTKKASQSFPRLAMITITTQF